MNHEAGLAQLWKPRILSVLYGFRFKIHWLSLRAKLAIQPVYITRGARFGFRIYLTEIGAYSHLTLKEWVHVFDPSRKENWMFKLDSFYFISNTTWTRIYHKLFNYFIHFLHKVNIMIVYLFVNLYYSSVN